MICFINYDISSVYLPPRICLDRSLKKDGVASFTCENYILTVNTYCVPVVRSHYEIYLLVYIF